MAQAKGPGMPAPDLPLQGGPGGELPPEPTPTDATGTQRSAERPPAVPVKIGGREYVVDPDIAQVLEEREQEFNRRLGEQSRELGDLRQWRQRVEGTIAPKREETSEEFDTQFYQSPYRALTRLLGAFKQELHQELGGAYDQDVRIRDFWAQFFQENPELRGEEFLVNAVYQQHFAEVKDLPLSKAREELAKQTRQQILRLSRKSSESNIPGEPRPSGRAVVEGGGTRRAAAAPPEEEEPTTLSEAIRQRAQARRKAREKMTGGG